MFFSGSVTTKSRVVKDFKSNFGGYPFMGCGVM
jgi:hypothetical protein